MRRNAFLGYLIAEVIVIVAVILAFKFITDRQVAATVAGFLFVGLPLALMIQEYRRAGFKNFVWYIAVLQFWLCFALPILGIRLLNWGVAFDELSFLGIPGQVLHQYSSKSYILMMAATVWFWWKETRRPTQN